MSKNFHWLLFILLEVVCVLLLFRYNRYQGSIFVSSANAMAGRVYQWQTEVEQFFSLEERASQLTQRNVTLEYELGQLRKELLTLKGDTATADSIMLGATQGLQMMPARVVSSTLRRKDNLLTIDRGSDDGIRPDMGVVSGTGVVGVVYMTSRHYSIVLPLINIHSRVSSAIRGSGYFGYLKWDGGNSTDVFMEDVPRHAQLRRGEWVETSGYSDIFPPGITVGQIIDIGNSADGLSYRLRVRLKTDFSCLHDVMVITDQLFSERQQMLQAARDSIGR